MRRVSVVGVTGSGKSTLAERLAATLGVAHVELDALGWEDDWVEADPAVFEERVRSAVGGEDWVIAGNWSRIQPLVWDRADTVVWLDLPFRIVFPRIVLRTVRRVHSAEPLWDTNNRETFRRAVGRDSIIRWQLKTFRSNRRKYPGRFAEWPHLRAIRLRRPAAVETFIAAVEAGSSGAYPPTP